jgi:hypothetical protein
VNGASERFFRSDRIAPPQQYLTEVTVGFGFVRLELTGHDQRSLGFGQ